MEDHGGHPVAVFPFKRSRQDVILTRLQFLQEPYPFICRSLATVDPDGHFTTKAAGHDGRTVRDADPLNGEEMYGSVKR